MKIIQHLKSNYGLARVFSLFRYMGDALIYAFLALYFHSLNLSPLETGTLLASVPVMAIVGNLIMSFLSRSVKYNLVLMKIIMPLEITGMVLIGFFNTFVPVLLCSILMNLCNSCFYSLLDGLNNDISTKAKKNYAGIRICGSIAYFIASFSGGFLISSINYRYTFIVGASVYLVAYVILYLIKTKELSSQQSDEKPASFLSIFKNKYFFLYFFSYIFLLGMNSVTDNFFAMYAKEINGMPENIYGIVYSSMILAEIITMFVTMRFKPKYNKMLLVISGCFLLTRATLLCFDLPYFMLYIIPLFRGFGWGMLLAVHLNTLKSIIQKQYLTKAILVLTIGLQVINTIFNESGPTIVANTSYHIFFIILACMGSIGLVLLILNPLKPLYKKDSPNIESNEQVFLEEEEHLL